MGRVATVKRFYVSGICCSMEETVLRKRLDAFVGTELYTFNAVTSELAIRKDVNDAEVIRQVGAAGFTARSKQELREHSPFWRRHAESALMGIAALLAIFGMVEENAGAGLASRILLGGAILVGGWKIGLKAYKAVLSRSLDMNFLMAIAVVGAVCIDKWAEGAAVIVLFGLSLVLETYSVTRSRRAIHELMSTSPDEATVLRGGKEVMIPPQQVIPGEVLVIRPGDRIPLDGVVIGGRSSVVQAAITGEATPVLKQPGAEVFAGSINERGSLRVQVTRACDDTMLARIVHLVQDAQQRRAPVQSFVERFARVYTPAVLFIAVLIAILPPVLLQQEFGTWFYRALVLLVIACPCALVISTPVTIVSAITFAARRGILLKGGLQLETLSKVKAVAFDKTGTLTEGKPRVTDILPLNSISRERALELVAAMEYHSEHHLASAIIAKAEADNIPYDKMAVESFEAVPGMGIEATIDGVRYYLGNRQFCEDREYCTPTVEERIDALAHEGKTAMVLGAEKEPIAIIAVRDTARHQSRKTIAQLRRDGILRMLLLSGDHRTATRIVAQDVGLDEYIPELLPEEKVKVVEKLKKEHGTVAMVGDGINDAPALAAASVGIAMGISGTDAALETADVVLMADDISRLPLLLRVSRKAMSIIKQNVTLALALKLVFLGLTVTGNATLWMAVLADDGAALAVILNGLRLLAFPEGDE